MDVAELPDAATFLDMTLELRGRHPALTNVLGSVADAVAAGTRYDSELWVVVRNEGTVVGAALRTAPWPLVATPMPPDAARAIGAFLAGRDPALTDISGPEDAATAIAAGMGRRHTVRMRDTVRVLGRLAEPPTCPGRARRAADEDLGLVLAWFAEFDAEARTPASTTEALVRSQVGDGRLWVWESADGEPTAMGGHARTVPTPNGRVGRIGPVYTSPGRRRRGYGSAVTHAVATALLPQCDTVMLYADAANPDSNSVYARLGFGAVDEIVELELG